MWLSLAPVLASALLVTVLFVWCSRLAEPRLGLGARARGGVRYDDLALRLHRSRNDSVAFSPARRFCGARAAGLSNLGAVDPLRHLRRDRRQCEIRRDAPRSGRRIPRVAPLSRFSRYPRPLGPGPSDGKRPPRCSSSCSSSPATATFAASPGSTRRNGQLREGLARSRSRLARAQPDRPARVAEQGTPGLRAGDDPGARLPAACFRRRSARRDLRPADLLGPRGVLSFLEMWSDETWGPRYLHSALGPLVLCFAASRRSRPLHLRTEAPLAAAVLLGLGVSFLGTLFYYGSLGGCRHDVDRSDAAGTPGRHDLEPCPFQCAPAPRLVDELPRRLDARIPRTRPPLGFPHAAESSRVASRRPEAAFQPSAASAPLLRTRGDETRPSAPRVLRPLPDRRPRPPHVGPAGLPGSGRSWRPVRARRIRIGHRGNGASAPRRAVLLDAIAAIVVAAAVLSGGTCASSRSAVRFSRRPRERVSTSPFRQQMQTVCGRCRRAPPCSAFARSRRPGTPACGRALYPRNAVVVLANPTRRPSGGHATPWRPICDFGRPSVVTPIPGGFRWEACAGLPHESRFVELDP